MLYLLIMNPDVVAKEVLASCEMWFSVLLPIMYPSFVIIDFIEHMPLVNRISKILYKPMHYIFHIHNEKSAF